MARLPERGELKCATTISGEQSAMMHLGFLKPKSSASSLVGPI